MGGVSTASSRLLVETALDSGFRHFDVAPSYGLGTAEDVLGKVLRQCRDQVTIATKVGIGRPSASIMLSFARAVTKPILRVFPPVREYVSARVGATKPRSRFDSNYVRESLAESLRRLQTAHIDLYLMHEIREGDATAELVAFLLESLMKGILGNVGTATAKEVACRLSAHVPELCHVRQFSWSVLNPPIDLPHEIFVITHGALRGAFKPMSEWIALNSGQAREWSNHLDRDVSDDAVLADLLLAASVSENTNGIVLVSSQQPKRIRRFATVVNDRNLLAAGRRFLHLVRECPPSAIMRQIGWF